MNILEERNQTYEHKYGEVLKKIKEYDRIAIFRHDHPDYDALGSQMAFVHFIKDNFPDKSVIYVGDNHVTLTGQCFVKMEEIPDEWFNHPFLGIVLDLSNLDRICDERAKKADYLIKIDHHPEVEPFGDLSIVDESMSAAGELIANLFFSLPKKYKVGKECATNLYKAIVGDSGRFLYGSTTTHTFYIAQLLLECGINITEIYADMYNQKLEDLEVTGYILRHYQITPHGVAYYVLDDATLKRFNLPAIRGKDNVNLFAHLDGINAWLSVTEDVKKGNWRVSLRSGGVDISHIAEKYNGGGHAQASGLKLKNLDELKNLLDDLDVMFK